MRILFLSGWFPYPPNNGSKLRIYNLLRGLALRHEVTLLSFVDSRDVTPDVSALRPFCHEVRIVPWKPFNPNSWRAKLGFLSLKPRSMLDTFSPLMAQQIEQALTAHNYDLAIASQWGMASYGQYFNKLAALLEEAELGVIYEQFRHATSAVFRLRYGLTWLKQRRYTARLLRYYRACTVASNRERQLLSSTLPGFKAIEVIPNCINVADYEDIRQAPRPNHLIFTGSFRYFANHDAMLWFLQEIYPRIRALSPEVHLTVTGDHAGQPLPPADNVTLTGFVDDVRPLVASAWVSLVPMRVGGGTRLKILEAMALGTPVVSTSKGAEGIEVRPGEHLLIADTPELFAEAVIRLLKEPGLRQQLAGAAYELVHEKYDWEKVMPRFFDLVEQTAKV